MPGFSMTVIGSGSAMAMHGRHSSAQVVRYDDLGFLIDCGEGTQERLRQAGVRPFSIHTILISHLHGDHVFGLPGLLSSYSHLKRADPLQIFGPPGIEGFLREVIFYSALRISFPLTITEVSADKPESIYRTGNLEVLSFPLHHRIVCRGYILRETSPRIRLRKAEVEELRLPAHLRQALQRGEDIKHAGREWPNAKLTYARELSVSYAYCSDTRFDMRIVPWLRGIAVLYHETTFMDDQAAMAVETCHSTASEAARIAAAAGVKCLVTGHYSSRYKDIGPLLAEARAVFGHVLEAEEGKTYDLRKLADSADREMA